MNDAHQQREGAEFHSRKLFRCITCFHEFTHHPKNYTCATKVRKNEGIESLWRDDGDDDGDDDAFDAFRLAQASGDGRWRWNKDTPVNV